jgi:hypothetical protein
MRRSGSGRQPVNQLRQLVASKDDANWAEWRFFIRFAERDDAREGCLFVEEEPRLAISGVLAQ